MSGPVRAGAMRQGSRPRFFTAYSFAIVTGGLFLLSLVAQLLFQVIEVRNDAASHGEAFMWPVFWPQRRRAPRMLRRRRARFLPICWRATVGFRRSWRP